MGVTRKYIKIRPGKGLPAGDTLYYECLICGDVVPSLPSDDTNCKCRNIMIDVGFSRMVIDNLEQARLFEVKVNPTSQP
jgi:hypothetical protein